MASSRVECRHPIYKCSFPSRSSMKQHFSASHTSSQVGKRKEKYARKLRRMRPLKTQEASQGHMHSVHLTLACNDCGKSNFKSADALHQHQLASVNHTHVSKRGTHMRTCSQCNRTFPNGEDLEQHFAEQHPISEVPKSGSEESTWQQVEACFKSAWINSISNSYKVHRILEVYSSGWKQAELEQYRKEVKTTMSTQKLKDTELHNKILHDGNELLRYHDISVNCKLGEPPNPNCNLTEALSLCMDKACNLCQTLQIGFKKSTFQVENFQSFEKSNYFSAASSKASHYVKCGKKKKKLKDIFEWFWRCFGNDASIDTKRNYKMVMVYRVIAGRPYHSANNLQNLENPPHGFHSVQGDPNKIFNYNDLIVHDDRAILISYLILYSDSN